MPVADVSDRRLDRVDLRLRLVVLSLHIPRDDHGAAVLGDLVAVAGVQRGFQVLDRRIRLDRPDDVVHRRTELRVIDRLGRALNEHELGLRVDLRECLFQDLVGLVRLADAGVLGAEGLRSDLHADEDCKDDEREPAEDRGLPVARAPAAHAGRDVVGTLEG